MVTLKTKVLLMTGLSGAGKTFSLKRLEDMGYEVIDNPPLFTLENILSPNFSRPSKIAIGMDTRTRDFEGETISSIIKNLRRREDLDFHVVFLDCEESVLYHRYSESRRPHPMFENIPIEEAIAHERILLEPLKNESDFVIDTTGLKAPEFKDLLIHHFGTTVDSVFNVHLTSFGFRYGIPRNIEFLFDVRFLSNPYYDKHLRESDGRDKTVQDHIKKDPLYLSFIERLQEMFEKMLPRYKEDLRYALSIGIGCTGGQHRSVFVAEELGRFFKEKGIQLNLYHRDVIENNKK